MLKQLDHEIAEKIDKHLQDVVAALPQLGPIQDLWNQANNIFQRSLPNVHAAIEASRQLREKVLRLLDKPKCVYDDKALALVSVLKMVPKDKRQSVRALITIKEQKALSPYVSRANWLSVEENSSARLLSGLIIQAIILPEHEDKKEVMSALATARICADELKEDAETLFDEAATFAASGVEDAFKTIARQNGPTLDSYGVQRIETPDGIRFRQESDA